MLACLLSLSLLWTSPEAATPEIAYMRGGEVRLVRTDGSNDRLVAKTDHDRQVSWYPDGKRLIYRHDSTDAGWNMYWINPETKTSGELTKKRTKDNRSPSFSPDGKRIAYISGYQGICVIDSEGTKVQILGSEAHRDVAPTWSADSRLLYFERHEESVEVLSIDVTTKAVKRVTAGMQHRLSGDRKIMFFIKPKPAGKCELWARNLPSGKEEMWLGTDWSPWEYNVDPNRATVAFYGPPGKPGIYVCSGPSKAPTKVGAVGATGVSTVEFSPDGKRLAYMSGSSQDEEVWIANIAAKTSRRLVKGSWPVWRP
ncbi:MAG: PD40 domain-containing protein [Fimbriimonadaceae bacterium]|nr:PD40 domain-containing protein [Fimbriimonadaceae bacterium]